MNAKNLATTMAALNRAASLAHLASAPGVTMSAGPAVSAAAGAAPQAAARGAEPSFSWDEVVADFNASLLGAASAKQGSTGASQEAVAASDVNGTGFTWDEMVADYNTTVPGAATNNGVAR